MLAENDWIGSYPLYAYEEYPSEQVQNDDKEQQPTSDIDWNKHNEQVLEKLRKEQQEKDLKIALEAAEE